MIQVLNNLLYYLNLAALLHSQHHNNSNNSLPEEVSSQLGVIYPLLVKQIPPGPIVPGVVVKFVCSTVEGDCHNGREERNISFQWEMYQYTEDQDGKLNNASVFRLPARDAEMEMEFNESVANPKVHCDLVCTVSNQRPSSASIKLNFQNKDDVPNLSSPLSFTVLGITSRTAYFAWRPPPPLNSSRKDKPILPSGFVIEYTNGRGRVSDWSDNAKVLRHEIKGGHTMAACISNLSPWTAYHFRIFAMGGNNISSVPSNPVSVYTLEDIPSASPGDIKVEADHENNLLKVSWKPPPRSEWNGSLLGYNIGFRKASSSSDSQPYTVHMLSPLERLVNPYEYEITVPDSSVPYEVVVQAFNNIGSGPFSKPVSQ